MVRFALAIGSAAALGLAAAAPLAAECDRAKLLAAVDSYIASQTAGTLDSLLKITSASNFTYVENNKVTDPKAGVLTQKLKIDNRRTIADTIACATYTELIAASGPKPYVIGTQIRHDPATYAVTVVDTIASSTGSWVFNATKTLEYVLKEDWFPIPQNKWDSRDLLQLAADAYLDLWSDSTAKNKIPWGTPCTRLEGSAYTGKGLPNDSCTPGIPTNSNQAPNINRRYVIDQASGSCSVFCLWQHMMNAADSHEFRLENGKLRYIHTMTVCPGKVCRL